MPETTTYLKMDFKGAISFLAVVGLCIPQLINSTPISSQNLELPLDYNEFESSRDPRQLSIFTPLRRAASTTREVVKFVRDYGMARYYNTTTPAPQTTVGKRATALLQHVTINSIREAVTSLLQSEAAPVVATFLKNIDRDTLQLFTSPERTPPSILARYTTTTVKPTTGKTNSTSSGSTKPGSTAGKTKNSTGNKKPTKAPEVTSESSAKKVAALAVAQKESSISGNSKNDIGPVKKLPTVNNEDEDDESNEDD